MVTLALVTVETATKTSLALVVVIELAVHVVWVDPLPTVPITLAELEVATLLNSAQAISI